jgi:hypothetical protein
MKTLLLSELRKHQYIATQDCLHVSVPQTPPLFSALSYPLAEGFRINDFPSHVHCWKSFTTDLTNLPLRYCRRPNVLLSTSFDIFFLWFACGSNRWQEFYILPYQSVFLNFRINWFVAAGSETGDKEDDKVLTPWSGDRPFECHPEKRLSSMFLSWVSPSFSG